MTTNQNTRSAPARAKRLFLAALLAPAVAVGIYGLSGPSGNPSARAATAEEIKALARDTLKGLIVHDPRPDVSALTLKDGDGNAHALSEWKGRVLLVNFWASWCYPCRREMPEIAKLQKAFPRDRFLVIAASEDRKGYAWAKETLSDLKAANLKLLMDPGAAAIRKLGERGLPLTIIVDREGREVARQIGPADWNADGVKALIKALLDEKD